MRLSQKGAGGFYILSAPAAMPCGFRDVLLLQREHIMKF
jgi:hypothetical protein